MLKKLINAVSKRNDKIENVCADWDKINDKILSQSIKGGNS